MGVSESKVWESANALISFAYANYHFQITSKRWENSWPSTRKSDVRYYPRARMKILQNTRLRDMTGRVQLVLHDRGRKQNMHLGHIS